MPILKFIEVEALKVIMADAKPKTFDFGGNAINLSIGVDLDRDLIKALNDDPLAWQKLQDAASDAYKDFVKASVADVKKTDQLVAKLVGDPQMQQATIDVCLAGIRADTNRLAKDVDKNVKAAWAQILKTNDDYKKYKIKAAVTVGLKTGGVVISLVGIGGAVATGGASAVIGVYGLIKGIVGLIKDLVKLSLSAEKMRIAINGQVTALVKAYKAEKTAIRNAQDFGKALINQVFATELATISKCSKDVDQYLSKLDGMDVKSHEISRKLGEALNKLDRAMKDLAQISKNNKAMAAALPKLEKSVNGLITDIVAKQQVINEGRAWGTTMKTALDLLDSGKPGWLKVFEKSFVLLDTGLAFNDLSGQADKALEIAFSAAAAADDLQDDFKKLANV